MINHDETVKAVEKFLSGMSREDMLKYLEQTGLKLADNEMKNSVSKSGEAFTAVPKAAAG